MAISITNEAGGERNEEGFIAASNLWWSGKSLRGRMSTKVPLESCVRFQEVGSNKKINFSLTAEHPERRSHQFLFYAHQIISSCSKSYELGGEFSPSPSSLVPVRNAWLEMCCSHSSIQWPRWVLTAHISCSLFGLMMLNKGSLDFGENIGKIQLVFCLHSPLMGRASLSLRQWCSRSGRLLVSRCALRRDRLTVCRPWGLTRFSPVKKGNDVFPWEGEEELDNRGPLWSSSAARFDGTHKSS